MGAESVPFGEFKDLCLYFVLHVVFFVERVFRMAPLLQSLDIRADHLRTACSETLPCCYVRILTALCTKGVDVAVLYENNRNVSDKQARKNGPLTFLCYVKEAKCLLHTVDMQSRVAFQAEICASLIATCRCYRENECIERDAYRETVPFLGCFTEFVRCTLLRVKFWRSV